MPNNNHILHLTLSFAPGGRRTAITTLTAASADNERHYLAVLNQYVAKQDEIRPFFSEQLELNRKGGAIDFSAMSRLKAFCLQHNIAIIHAHDAASQMTGALLRLFLPKIKLMMTFHRSLGMESTSWKDKLRNALSCFMSEQVLCASTERRTHFLSENYISSKKVKVIPLGVDTEVFQGVADGSRRQQRAQLHITENTFVIGAIGHFGDEKGIDCAINTFNDFIKSHADADAHLLIIGQGDAQRTALLHDLADQADGKITFLGYRKNIPELMQAMDCFLHMPRMEAFGLVLIEAMASGLPVIATEVGGIPDIVVHRQTGFLLDENDQSGYRQALEKLYHDVLFRQLLGETGRKRALSDFSASLYAQRHAQLYQQLLA